MSCHIGGTVDLLQIVHGDIFQIISHFRAVRIDIAIVAIDDNRHYTPLQ